MKDEFSFTRVRPVNSEQLTPYYQGYSSKLADLLRTLLGSEADVEGEIGRLVDFMKSFQGQSVIAAYGSARELSPVGSHPIVSQIGEEMLQSVFEAVATRGCGLVHGAAGNGYMGAFHRQWAAVIEEYGLSREFAPEFLVPLGLSKEFRKKEPYLDLWKNPPTGVYTCPEIPDLDLRWAVMNYPRMLLGAVVATGGLGTLKEVLDTMLARQLKAASFTPFSFKHYLVDELGWSKDDPRLENLDPLIFVLDEWVEQDSLFVPGTRVKGWYYGDFLAGLLMQLERGTISAGDLSRIRVIRVGSRSTEQEHNLLRYSHLLNVQYLSLEEIGPYVVDELRRVYEAKASLFEQLNQLRAA